MQFVRVTFERAGHFSFEKDMSLESLGAIQKGATLKFEAGDQARSVGVYGQTLLVNQVSLELCLTERDANVWKSRVGLTLLSEHT